MASQPSWNSNQMPSKSHEFILGMLYFKQSLTQKSCGWNYWTKVSFKFSAFEVKLQVDLSFLSPSIPFGWTLMRELGGFGVSDLLSVSGFSSEAGCKYLSFLQDSSQGVVSSHFVDFRLKSSELPTVGPFSNIYSVP